MNQLIQVAVTSTSSALPTSSSIIIWDPTTGTNLRNFKDSENTPFHALSFISNEYMITADSRKPLLRIWPLWSITPLGPILRTHMPGQVTALTVDPDGIYCVCGISDKLYIWELSSGKLLNFGEKHFQKITNIKFTDDGSHIVSAGDDGLIVLWSLALLINKYASEPKPRHVFSDHSAPVTDIYVGRGSRCHLVSVSLDRTLNFYLLALRSPSLLFSIIFESPLSSVCMNNCETKIFIGLSNGDIQEFNLREPPRTKEYHISEKDTRLKFIGHTDQVNSLSVSCDGNILLSGSNDKKIIFWDITTRQPIRTILQQAPVLNVLFKFANKNIFSKNQTSKIKLNDFQKNIDKNSPLIISKLVTEEEEENMITSSLEQELREENEQLKRINQSLVELLIDKKLGVE